MNDALIVAIIFFSLVAVLKIISDNKIRSKLIDKGLVDEKVKHLYANNASFGVLSSLKWGFVLIGVGLAFLIGEIVPYSMKGEITVGSMFILAGLGLLIFYFIFKKKSAELKD